MSHSTSVGVLRETGRRRRRVPGGGIFTGLDALQGILIALLIGAGPWLFGCTEPWSVALMNVGCFAAAAVGLLIRLNGNFESSFERQSIQEKWLKRAFLSFNGILLAFIIVAYFNARASFSIQQQAFTYFDRFIQWLPTTYDVYRTRSFLISNLALCAIFWSTRDWFLRKGFAFGEKDKRFRLIAWIFLVNGFLVAIQGLLQRFSGSAKLLWFRTPYWADPLGHFGPFSYRGNAVDYLNLVWPLTFGVWHWMSARRKTLESRFGDGPELLLLPMFLLTLIASFATLSRGGVLVAGTLVLALLIRLTLSKTARVWKILTIVSLVAVVFVAFSLVGNLLIQRFRQASTDQLGGRAVIYQNARQMAVDFPWFGTGPGTFQSIYCLYREDPKQPWAAFLHDDWMETRVTFGRIGFALVLLQFALYFLWTWSMRDRWISPMLSFCFYLSIAGCLIHAKADFPFQTYGVTFTFVIVCALLTVATHPAKAVKAEGDLAHS